jgi:ATP-dependent RNA helicase DDX51/DBP6
MARGMDLSNVDAVVNYDLPGYVQTYVHRVGRTARAGASGSAYTLVKASQFKAMRRMLHQADNSFYSKFALPSTQETETIMQAYQNALAALKNVLQLEKKGEQDPHAPVNVSFCSLHNILHSFLSFFIFLSALFF